MGAYYFHASHTEYSERPRGDEKGMKHLHQAFASVAGSASGSANELQFG